MFKKFVSTAVLLCWGVATLADGPSVFPPEYLSPKPVQTKTAEQAPEVKVKTKENLVIKSPTNVDRATVPTITMPKEMTVPTNRLSTLLITSEGEQTKYVLVTSGEADMFREYDPSSQAIRLRLIGYTDGKAEVMAYTGGVVDGKLVLGDPEVCHVTFGVPVPVPPGPVPPGPNPPGPTPVPVPGGLRVLIRYETGDFYKLPQSQQTAMRSTEVFSYLSSHCAKGTDGKTPEFRFWDKDLTDTDLAGESQVWKDAWKLPTPTVPYIHISNGKDSFSGELPKSKDELLTLLKKYGGP